MSAPEIPIAVDKRVPADDQIVEMAVNYAGATLLMEVRPEPGGDGTPLLSLSNASPPTQGLSVTYDAAYPDPDGILPNGGSIVRFIISETTLEGLSYGSPASEPVVLHYDIHLTPSSGTKFIFAQGTFTIHPGVTR